MDQVLNTSFKHYFLFINLIKKEVGKITDNDLKDALIFFLIAFGYIEQKEFKIDLLQDVENFKKYIKTDPYYSLTEKGLKLFQALDKKIDQHVQMLNFNKITPKDLAKTVSALSRFQKFWHNFHNFY